MIKKFVTIALAAIATLGATAQNGTMTPYSRYAYGMLGDHATSAQRAMGGVGYAMNSGRQINVMNPASYAAIDSLTFLFDIGLDLTSLHSSEMQADGKVSENQFGGGLAYVTMQFPICKYVGASVGLVPYSSVGYAFGSKIHSAASPSAPTSATSSAPSSTIPTDTSAAAAAAPCSKTRCRCATTT